MKYAGFWRRLGALLIDGAVGVPFAALSWFLEGISREVALGTAITFAALYWSYDVYFHARWGATLGKMAMRIKVVRESDGGDIGYRESLLRYSVDLAFGVLVVIGNIIAITHFSASEYLALGWWERRPAVWDAGPGWTHAAGYFHGAWIWSELVVLMLNKRKRAVHDYIAGTVVIHSETQPVEGGEFVLGR